MFAFAEGFFVQVTVIVVLDVLSEGEGVVAVGAVADVVDGQEPAERGFRGGESVGDRE